MYKYTMNSSTVASNTTRKGRVKHSLLPILLILFVTILSDSTILAKKFKIKLVHPVIKPKKAEDPDDIKWMTKTTGASD